MANVYVVGSINMDVVATAARHPVVGETVAGTSLAYFPGGKGANQAVAAARAGAATSMVGRLGSDGFSGELSDFLAGQGIDLQFVDYAADLPSGTALIVVAGGDNTIVVVPGANAALSAKDVAALRFKSADVVVAQFETPIETTIAAFALATECDAHTVLNPAPAADIPPRLLSLARVVVVNETELSSIAQQDVDAANEASITHAVETIRAFPEQVWIVTLGSRGLLLSDAPNSLHNIAGHKVDVKDTTGAGDCFVGVFAASVAAGQDVVDAATRANAAAALCVQIEGAGPSMPTEQAVIDFLG